MAKAAIAERREPLAGEKLANKYVTIEAAAAASRISLRASEAGTKSFEKGLGFKLPRKPKTSASKGGKHALWLGPDEWIIINEDDVDTSMVPRLPNKEFAATEISHRNAAVIVSGAGAQATLSAGCPQNLSLATFPVGACSRTVFGKAEVILYRTCDDTFRMEFWRSYSEYIWDLLNEAAKDAHI